MRNKFRIELKIHRTIKSCKTTEQAKLTLDWIDLLRDKKIINRDIYNSMHNESLSKINKLIMADALNPLVSLNNFKRNLEIVKT